MTRSAPFLLPTPSRSTTGPRPIRSTAFARSPSANPAFAARPGKATGLPAWDRGLGSRTAPSGDLPGRLVYAMRVEEVFSLQEYDRQAPADWPHPIPNAR